MVVLNCASIRVLVLLVSVLRTGAKKSKREPLRKSEFARKNIDFKKLEEDYGVHEEPPNTLGLGNSDIAAKLSYAFMENVCEDMKCAEHVDKRWGNLIHSGGVKCHHGTTTDPNRARFRRFSR